ncbi:uncharacterized protein Z520_11797 [Fonsecaea multimorphosa CBS 102226]|uniref:Heterokaryon incompatibility domain-containing protein n=1 Tax=Fonsecaea multimorphosa CBS 102226 TaxID=1442371 RepID=A0A0D2JH15_9EURO|nr:uncharacterized protein Z520_11797 [Fonsecaea multimorphosa CBS 102226]KIX92477.1 hypothetical protein Z520_11797 [Fonsecaea multimorphosa CBS 102226]OAL19593.1 hypothetical protein AYO22_09755 [Fonsecaea multimorphosa]
MVTSAAAVHSNASSSSAMIGDTDHAGDNTTLALRHSLYLPLDQEQQEIRILTLHAGGNDTPIEATLESTCFSNAGSFIAFSYCWGSPDDGLEEVILDGHAVGIRRNLWLFLRNFRSVRGSSRLWIDYLCIDQSNVQERNHQVRLMEIIFSTAHTVYAWLGEADSETDDAIAYIKIALSIPRRSRPKEIPPDVRRRGLRAMKLLTKSKYWSRVWIIQEVLLARKVVLMIGDKIIDWEHLQNVFTAGVAPNLSHQRKSTETSASQRNFRHIWELKQIHRKVWDLYSLLDRFRFAHCHDPRDRLYGLLGLTSESVRSKAVIDYSLTLMEVCAANVQTMLSEHGTTHNLRYVHGAFSIVSGNRENMLRAFKDRSLLSRVGNPVVVAAYQIPWVERDVKTVVGFSLAQNEYVQLTSANEALYYDLYLTILHEKLRQQTHVYCTTTHCREWNNVLELTAHEFTALESRVILPVRKKAGSLEIIEIGGHAKYKKDSDGIVGIWPSDWLVGKVPDAQCSPLDRGAPDLPWLKPKWDVQLNSSALMEIMRIMESGKRWNLRDLNLPLSLWKDHLQEDPDV